MRSWMFVPGNSQKMIDKALGSAADAIMLDLEDGVVPELKPAARPVVAQALQRLPLPRAPARFVRVNGVHTPELTLDLEAVVVGGLEGITLPKAETAEEVRVVSEMLTKLERERGLRQGAVRLMLAVETAKGLFAAAALAAASPRVIGLMFGAEDFSTDVGLSTIRTGMAREFLYARSAIVYAAAASGVIPVDAVWADLKDIEGLRRDSEMARALGFLGKSMVHPSHIEVVNELFTPTAAEVDFSRGLMAAFEKAVGEGQGSISYAGKLVDRPIYARAVATVRLADRIAKAG
jgi:citrate lyase subunit beta/citryl-CoA lyase